MYTNFACAYASVADPGSEERGLGGLPPRFFCEILANLGHFLKCLVKIGGRRCNPPPPLDPPLCLPFFFGLYDLAFSDDYFFIIYDTINFGIIA